METFTNETIDTTQLPRYEEVQFTVLQSSYWKVLLLNIALIFVVLAIALGIAIYNDEKAKSSAVILISVWIGLLIVILFYTRLSFKKKAFAFRNHDVLFRSGVIATSTLIIPYNRVQHVSLHEGIFSRIFGLAKVEIFTAGGNSSDVEIPGIAKSQAEDIKQLLMGKIQKEL